MSSRSCRAFRAFAEILDDAVVHDGDAVGRVRMRVALGRAAMRCPAGMANADIAGERLKFEAARERAELAFGAAARKRAVIERSDAGRIVAAVFQALERIDQMAGDGLSPDDSDDPAHAPELAPVLGACFNRRQ